jgi:hypothetical protein
MKTFSISRYIFLALIIFPFSLAAQSNQLYTTTEIKKDGDKCKIGSNQPIDWCKSPCEKMYGNLPKLKCP